MLDARIARSKHCSMPHKTAAQAAAASAALVASRPACERWPAPTERVQSEAVDTTASLASCRTYLEEAKQKANYAYVCAVGMGEVEHAQCRLLVDRLQDALSQVDLAHSRALAVKEVCGRDHPPWPRGWGPGRPRPRAPGRARGLGPRAPGPGARGPGLGPRAPGPGYYNPLRN